MTDKAKDIATALGVQSVTIVGSKNGPDSDPVVVYTSPFKGKNYAHIRTVYLKDGKWAPGKGMSFDAANAKTVFEAIGKVSV